MKVSLLSILIDPNDNSSNFSCYGLEVDRDGNTLNNLDKSDLLSSDDIRSGIVINDDNDHIYPITNFVLSIFSDIDLEARQFLSLLNEFSSKLPNNFAEIVNKNIKRIESSTTNDSTLWNTEEMDYYDKNVSSDEKRKLFLNNIKTLPIWNIFIERKKYLLDNLDSNVIEQQYILEIGCGNARTISWVFPPKVNNYNYVGTDISLKRLILAKQAIPESDFVQCSAFNLPFANSTFRAAIAFGVLHHLPDPLAGISSTLKTIKENGSFLIHEPIEKPSKIFSGGRFKKLEAFFEGGYEHSEHDKEINVKSLLKFFKEENVSINSTRYTISAFRTIFGLFISKISFLKRSHFTWKTLLFIDQICIKLFCWKPSVFGPGAILLVAKKGSQ